MKPYVYLFFVAGALFLSSCNQKDKGDNSPASAEAIKERIGTNVVLQVDAGKFTEFELKKNFNTFKQTFTQKNRREPTEEDVKAWANDFIERGYILADARARGYYDREDIKKTTESMASLMLTQPHGIMDNKIMAAVSMDEVKKAADAQPGANINAITSLVKQKAIAHYRQKINIRSAVKADKRIVTILNKVLARYGKAHEIKKSDISDILTANLATYRSHDNTITGLSVGEFADYYNNLPLKRILADTNVIMSYVYEIAANGYIINDAKTMGITDDPEFRISKKNFTDNIVFRKYQEEQLTGELNVTEDEILKAYNEVKAYMLRPTQIEYSVFTFTTLVDAIQAQNSLRMNPTDTGRLKNTLSEKRHIKFDERNARLIDTLKKALIRLHPGESSFPVKTNDYYTVLLMESAGGSKPMEIAEVRPYLAATALEKRRAVNRHARVAMLAEKYKKTGEINTAMFLSPR